MKGDSLGDRMKGYEDVQRRFLTRRVPVIMRLDGRAFHTFTKKYCERPFDEQFSKAMTKTAEKLMEQIQGAKLSYIQSDEISILIRDDETLLTEGWFNYNIQKMVSISASIACQTFAHTFFDDFADPREIPLVCFDSRVFNIPESDIPNYFIWRQKDWERNSLQMYCRQFFSQKQMHGKKTPDMHEMLHGIDKNWATLPEKWKNGTFIVSHEGVTYKSYEKVSYDDLKVFCHF